MPIPFKREFGGLNFNRSASGWQPGEFPGHLPCHLASTSLLAPWSSQGLSSILIFFSQGEVKRGRIPDQREPSVCTGHILAMCIEYDAKYSLRELRTICVEAGLSPSGHKKLLAAKLIAHQWEGDTKEKAEQLALFTF